MKFLKVVKVKKQTKGKYKKNLKLVLPYDKDKKREEINHFLSRQDAKIYKIKMIQPPVLYKKDFDKNEHQQQLEIMKQFGYELPANNIVFNEDKYTFIFDNIEFKYNWIDSLKYFIV